MGHTIHFWKVQSIGNHFPMIHLDELGEGSPSLPEITQILCHEHYGIGGDGLLVVGMEGTALRLRMFNPDGTEDFCGNGIRCAANHAHRLGWVPNDFIVLHQDRRVPTHVAEDGRIASVIGSATYEPSKVPMVGPELFDKTVWSGIDSGVPMSLFGSVLSTGSTHTVIPTTVIPDDDSFASVSAKIEVDPKFPQRTSVIWRREVAPNKLEIRIWERGVGETLGCGTGSSAAAADYLRRKGTSGTVEVINPGGTVFVTAAAWDAPLKLEGYASEVFSGTVDLK